MGKNGAAAAFLAVLLMGLPALGQQPLQPRTMGGVTYVSGGIGAEEREAMKAMEGSYNLRLLFVARDSGEYLWGVKVQLLDGAGKTLLSAVSDGPYFLAKVDPGRYTIVAEDEGRAIRKSVDIAPGRAVSEQFTWPSA